MKSITGKFVELIEVNMIIVNKQGELFRRNDPRLPEVERQKIAAQYEILEEVRREIMKADWLENSLHLDRL